MVEYGSQHTIIINLLFKNNKKICSDAQQLFIYSQVSVKFFVVDVFILIIIEVFCLVMAYKHSQLTKKKQHNRKKTKEFQMKDDIST